MTSTDSPATLDFDAMAEAFTAACGLQAGSQFLSPFAAATSAGYLPGSDAHEAYRDTYLSSIADGIHVCALTGIVISVTDEQHSRLFH